MASILFLIYINHIVSELKSKVVLFVDALKLYLTLPLTKSYELLASTSIQNNVSLFFQRNQSWDQNFSVNKCARIHFSTILNSVHVDYYYIVVNSVPNNYVFTDLGVLVAYSLRIHLHMKKVSCKASGVTITSIQVVCRTSRIYSSSFHLTHYTNH